MIKLITPVITFLRFLFVAVLTSSNNNNNNNNNSRSDSILLFVNCFQSSAFNTFSGHHHHHHPFISSYSTSFSTSPISSLLSSSSTMSSSSTSTSNLTNEDNMQMKRQRQEPESLTPVSKKAKPATPPEAPIVIAKTATGATLSKRVSKQINRCGKNYKAALQKLFTVYPFLQFPIDGEDDSKDDNTNASTSNSNSNSTNRDELNLIHLFDAFRAIGSAFDTLGKTNQPYLGIKLLNQILSLLEAYDEKNDIINSSNNNNSQQHQLMIQSRKISFLHLIYKSIIGMIGQSIPKQQREKQSSSSESTPAPAPAITLNGEYIIQLLYYDLPTQTIQRNENNQSSSSPPLPIDVYHNTLSALGKCKRMDLIMKVLHDMESNRIIKLPSSLQSQSSNILEYQLPKPDRTTYSTALTASIRCKTYKESIHILQSMKHHEIYPQIFAYNQVLSCISNSGSMFGTSTGADTDTNMGNGNGSNNNETRFQLTQQILNELEHSDDEMVTEKKKVVPTQDTYKIIMAIYAKENKWDEIKQIKQKMVTQQQQSQQNLNSNDDNDNNNNTNNNDNNMNSKSSTAATTNVKIKTKRGSVQSRNNNNKEIAINDSIHIGANANTSIVLQHIHDLKKLEKMNSKRSTWYKLGTYKAHVNEHEHDGDVTTDDISFAFGIQTHRNPSENGLSLVFHEEGTQEKLGYMLIRNTIGQAKQVMNIKNGKNDGDNADANDFVLYSSFMGMYIDEGQRGKRLASKCIAIWLSMCLKSNALPLTEIINKPLLSLVLTKNFGFIPKDDESGIEVEVCPLSHVQRDKPSEKNRETGWYPDFAMYSTRIRPDDGTFGERELRIQKMMITKFPPVPRGKVTYVKTSFDHPLFHLSKSNNASGDVYDSTKKDLEQKIGHVLGGNGLDDGKVTVLADNELLRRVLFGFLYESEN